MGKAFKDYTFDDAAKWLPHAPTGLRSLLVETDRRPASAIRATNFYNGNHWQDGSGFIGQLPPKGLAGYKSIISDIQAGFVSENVIQEVTETHVGGILGREPAWTFVDKNADEATRTDQASFGNATAESLTPWWNDRAALDDLQATATTLVLEGKVVRRLFIPRGLVPDGKASATDIESALKFIYFENHTADIAGVFIDPDTQAEIGIFMFEERDVQGEVLGQAAELSFLNSVGETVVKVVRDNNRKSDEFGPYQLGGHLLLFELDRRALITEQVQSMQRALNLAHTMMMRNVNMAGNRERTITNAKPPEEIKRVTTASTGQQVTQPFPGYYRTGAGATNFLWGQPIYDDDGAIKGYTNPNVIITDPAPVNTFVETTDHYRSGIYNQVHQRHVLIVDKADTSGRAREIARREFERSLKESKSVLDASGRWELEVVIRLAAQIASLGAKYLNLRADFNCLIDAGEPDPEKQKTTILMRDAGLISAETARNWIGVEDANAELARIKAESKSDPSKPASAKPLPQVVTTPPAQPPVPTNGKVPANATA
jgi:hypothetical protein